uniref:endo-1,3(4)-beta-glucanase n=1 Tax=Paecilomyces sp. FLH30 TaxID=993616 RepID=G4WNE9_9EURO|nr:beta-1,3(4)-glucanase [Paecilomyces sp. FLH30]
MHIRSTPILFAGLSSQQLMAAYVLIDDYGHGNGFFNKFNFFTGEDPTHGFVDYVSRNVAQGAGLLGERGDRVYMGVDYTNPAGSRGRRSVRLESKNTYEHGLVVIDLAHMPGSVCGTWPAFWALGTADWPFGGEIDIIEGVNDNSFNHMILHTSDGCTINDGGFTGNLRTSNCYIYAPGQNANAGCGIEATNPDSYGRGFNSLGGGIYATDLTSNGISIWFFPRGSELRVLGDNPNPANWGTPAAKFAGGSCDFESKFNGQRLIFDITFCGDWAGSVWGIGGCASRAGNCNDFVQDNPSAFTESYWLINSLKVYPG